MILILHINFRLFLCTVLFLPTLSFCQCSQSSSVTVSGVLTCSGTPIPFVDLRLVQEIGIVPSSIGSGVTDAEGRFSVSGRPFRFVRRNRPAWDLSLFVQLSHTYKSNNKRAFAVRPLHILPLEFHEGVEDVGEVAVNEYSCNTYLRLYEALNDFNTRTGRNLRAITNALHNLPEGSIPFTDYRGIRLPKKYKITGQLARHELAHVVRNMMDGDSAHFAQDVQTYGGVESHNCLTETSNEFAFNEGWAFYWARECMDTPTSGKKNVGGDVAKLLRELQAQHNTSDNDMWLVLQRNPGQIHTYDEFEEAHNTLHS